MLTNRSENIKFSNILDLIIFYIENDNKNITKIENDIFNINKLIKVSTKYKININELKKVHLTLELKIILIIKFLKNCYLLRIKFLN